MEENLIDNSSSINQRKARHSSTSVISKDSAIDRSSVDFLGPREDLKQQQKEVDAQNDIKKDNRTLATIFVAMVVVGLGRNNNNNNHHYQIRYY